MSNRVWRAWIVAVVAAVAPVDPLARADRPAAPAGARTPAPARPLPARAFDTRFDLVRWAHLCSLFDDDGLFIDLGTPAASVYTRGRAGWGDDVVVEDDVTAAIARTGESSLLVPRDGARGETGETIEIRGRAVVRGSFSLYVNDRVVSRAELPTGRFGTVRVDVPAGRFRPGDNVVSLRFEASGRVVSRLGERVRGAALVDWVRVGGIVREHSVHGPRFGEIVQLAQAEGRAVPALRLATGLTLRCLLPAFAEARLQMDLRGPADARLDVRLATEGQEPRSISPSAPAVEAGETMRSIDAPLAGGVARVEPGEVVALELAAQGPAGAVLLLLAPRVVAPARPRRPVETGRAKNVVVLLIDTLRADKLRAFNPATRVASPTIGSLAAEATIFTRARAPENWTKPSVATLLSSLAPATHNAKTEEAILPSSVRLLPEILREQGFATGSFIANGFISGDFGFRQGWDAYKNYVRTGVPSRADLVFDDALDWLRGLPSDRRFLLYVHTIEPHVPYTPPRRFLELYDAEPYRGIVVPNHTEKLLDDLKLGRAVLRARDRARLAALYDGEITHHDGQLRRLIDGLKATGRFDETLFVLVSDHGEEFFEHGSAGHGHSVHGELLDVPLLMRMPGFAPAGLSVDDDVGVVDVAPTILDALGVPVPADFQGRSLAGAIRGEPADGPAGAFSEFLDSSYAVRCGRYAGLLVRGRIALYDVERDPTEQSDLAATRPLARRFVQTLLYAYLGSADRALRSTAPVARRPVLRRHEATIAPQTAAQLRALGYAGGGR